MFSSSDLCSAAKWIGPVITVSRDIDDLNGDGLTGTQLISTDGAFVLVLANGLMLNEDLNGDGELSGGEDSNGNGGNGFIGVAENAVTLAGYDVVFPGFDDESATPVPNGVLAGVEYYSFAHKWDEDGIDNNGDGSVDGPEEAGYYAIYSAARNGSVERMTETITRQINVNIWGNALFGGPGDSNGVVSGDAAIHGSVHILGDNILEGGVVFGGMNTVVSNSYEGVPENLLNERVDAPAQRQWQDEAVVSLGAQVQIKKGIVLLSNSASLGGEDTPGNDTKETLDAIFVTDGWIGELVESDGYRGVPGTVHADNDTKSLYNLGDKVFFPLLDGTLEEQEAGVAHTDIFQAMTGAAYGGDLTISTDNDFYFNASQPGSVNPDDINANDDFIWFDAESNQLEIGGQVLIDGSLMIVPGTESSPAVPNETVYYKGIGALLAKGDVTIQTDLLTGDVVLDDTVDFVIEDERVRPLEDFRVEVTVLGADYGYPPLPVTARVNIGGTWHAPWGSYDDHVNANLNDGEIHTWEAADTYPADTFIGVEGKSWRRYSRRGSYFYYEHLEVDSWSGSDSVFVLRTGDLVPDISGYMDQDSLSEYISDYIDHETNTIALLDNQVIFLFELGQTTLTNPGADFQDLVVLVSLYKPDDEDGEEGEGGEGEASGPSVTPLRFPENVLGFMAANNINIAGDGTEVMGAFYAQSSVQIADAATVVGAMVANQYDMGGSAPCICQVPALQNSMPEGMIGTDPIISVDQLSWREVSR